MRTTTVTRQAQSILDALVRAGWSRSTDPARVNPPKGLLRNQDYFRLSYSDGRWTAQYSADRTADMTTQGHSYLSARAATATMLTQMRNLGWANEADHISRALSMAERVVATEMERVARAIDLAEYESGWHMSRQSVATRPDVGDVSFSIRPSECTVRFTPAPGSEAHYRPEWYTAESAEEALAGLIRRLEGSHKRIDISLRCILDEMEQKPS